jgi:hypothetical protein
MKKGSPKIRANGGLKLFCFVENFRKGKLVMTKKTSKTENLQNQFEGLVMPPTIEIDKDALRFHFKGSSVNLFWDNLFTGSITPSFQTEVMRCLHRAYIECIKNDEKSDTD